MNTMDFDLNECESCLLAQEEFHDNQDTVASEHIYTTGIMMKQNNFSSEHTAKTDDSFCSLQSIEEENDENDDSNSTFEKEDFLEQDIYDYEQQEHEQERGQLRVCFDLDATIYHTDPVAFLLTEERENTWYDKQTIASLDDQFRDDVEDSLEQPEQPASSGKLLSYLWKNTSALVQQRHRRTTVETLKESLKTCCRAKNEHAMAKAGDLVHKEALQKMYQSCNVLGLEQELLGELRGSPASLVVAILDQVDLTVEEQEKSQDEYPMSGHELIAHISLYTSRPSRILAHELALALHASIAPPLAQQPLAKVPVSRVRASRRGSMFGAAMAPLVQQPVMGAAERTSRRSSMGW